MIELKPLSIANVNIHYQWNNDEELNYYDSDFPHNNEPFESFLSRMKRIVETKNTSNVLFEVYEKQSNRMIGIVDIHEIDVHNKKCSIECTIGNKSYRNQGYGKAAFVAGLTYCFETLGMHKVSTSAFDFNENWIALATKLGFKKEGLLREHAVKRGKYSDKIIFGMLGNEFDVLKKALVSEKEAVLN
ncbi:N-acetyltransferase [bacterium]|nr:MAG: N-acetyltransferase [bacterium]